MNGSGRVLSVAGDKAQVQVDSSASCAGCTAKEHCHGSSGSTRVLTAINRANAQPGDTVVFEADAKRVVFSAALIWILPIIAMIVGYFAGELLAGGIVPIIAAFIFLGASLALLKLIDSAVAGGSAFYPVITAIVDDTSLIDHHCN